MFCIGNYMLVITRILYFECNLEKTCTSEFFKDYQNCTSLKGECKLKSLKNPQAKCMFFQIACTRNHTITY